MCVAGPDGTTCEYFSENPAGGLISFDSTLMAGLQILQTLTFDTWTDAMYMVMDGVSEAAWIWFFLIQDHLSD